MSIVEDRIVAMKFDNKQFEAAVKVTMATLGHLKKGLSFSGSGKGLDEVSSAVDGQEAAFASLIGAIEGTKSQFSLLGAIGFTAVQRVTNGVIDLGKKVVGGALSGGLDRAMKIEQAQFKFRGLGQDVEASMDAALSAVKGTAYGLDAAAAVASQFGAAGMEAGEEMAGALRGVSGMASMAGVSYEEIGHIFTTVAGEGKLSTMRLQQFATRGVNAAAELANQLGVTEAEVRSMVTNGEIDFITFANAMNEAFGEHATKANETYTGSLSNMNAALSRVGAMFHAPRLEAMRDIFNALTDVIDEVADGLEPLVDDFTEFINLGSEGFVKFLGQLDLSKLTDFIAPVSEGIFNLLNGIVSLINPIRQAFKEVFSAGPIIEMAESFRDFTRGLEMGSSTAGKLRRTFKGVFAIFSIGFQIVQGILNLFGTLFQTITGGSGGILSFTANIGDWLVKVDEALKKGNLLSGIFTILGNVLSVPIMLFSSLASAAGVVLEALGSLGQSATVVWGILAQGTFKGGVWDEDSSTVRALFKVREALVWLGGAASQVWNILARGKFVSGVFSEDSAIVAGLLSLRDMLGSFFNPANLAMMFGAGAAGSLALALRGVLRKGFGFAAKDTESLMDKFKGVFDSVRGSFDGVTEIFGSLTGALRTMQADIKANIILKIAIAVGILATSLKLLASIDGGDLAMALGAMTAAFVQLLGAMTVLTKIAGTSGFTAIPTIAGAMIALSVAILILSTAVKTLSSLSWEELLKGLLGVAGLLGMIVAASWGLSKVQGSIMRTAVAMIPLAVGLRILASAVKAFATMSWEEMGRGLAGLAGALVVIGGALRILPKGMVAIGAGLLAVSAAAYLLGMAVKQFANMSWDEMARGAVGLAGGLLIIAGAMRLMPKGLAATSVGLILVAVALQGIVTAVSIMGGMSWEDLAKGLIGLGGALGILALALTFMNSTIAGSAALLIAAVAISTLIPPLIILSALSWGDLIKGLLGLAGILTVLGIAGALLTPVIPTLLGLGAALLLLGLGLASAGLGAQAIVAALSMFVSLINKSKDAVVGLIALIPEMIVQFALGIVGFATTLASHSAQFVGAFKDLILALLDALIEITPKIGEALKTMLLTLLDIIVTTAPAISLAFTILLITFLQSLERNVPLIINSVFNMMISFLTTIRDRIPEVVRVVVDIITAFIDTIAEELPRITESAANLIITFVESLAKTIRDNTERMKTAGRDLAFAIVDGMTGGLLSKVGEVASAAANLARRAIGGAKDELDSHSPSREFIKIGEDVGDGLVIGVENSMSKVAKVGSKLATGLMTGFSKGIGTEMPKAIDSIFKTLDTGVADARFWGPNNPATDQLLGMHQVLKDINFEMAVFYGEVDLANPESLEAYTEKAGQGLTYLAGAFDGLKDAASTAFGMLASGAGLDEVLGSTDVLSSILSGLLTLLPGVEGALISVGIAVVDGLLGMFLGPDVSVLGFIGDVLSGTVKFIAGLFGIELPSAKKEIEEGEQAVEDFLVTVEGGHGRFQKLAEDGIETLAASMAGVTDILDGVDTTPKITPVLDLTEFNKEHSNMLESLDKPVDISTSTSEAQANSLYKMQQDLKDAIAEAPSAEQNTSIEYNQYNTSPKALSHVEIYRQTKNQLSLVKDTLGV